MSVETKYFLLGDEHSAQEWGTIVATLTKGIKVGERIVEQTYLDTFDWAFCRAGYNIITESFDGGLSLSVRGDVLKPKLPKTLPIDKHPVWPADLPDGKLKKELAKRAGFRCFMPVAHVKSEQIIIQVQDKKERERVRLIVEVNFQRPAPRRKMIELGCRLRVECLAGYEKDFTKMLAWLDGLQKTTQMTFFHQLAENVGKVPLDYSNKLNITLERDMRSDEALKTILIDQLRQIEVNIDGTLENLDTEFLHHLRVAVRRSRSALSRMKGVLPITVQERFAKELAWIGSITTPVRDLDVYMIDFPKYRAKLSVEQQANIEPLYDFLKSQYAGARKQLITDLKSPRFKEFLTKWRTFLEKPLAARPTAPNAILPVGEVADKRIWRTYRRVMTEGKAIYDETPAEALHDLRKTCKKLRYLLEFFASLYEGGQVKALVKHLKVLQENLGDFQDLDVQADTLHEYSTKMMQAGESRPQVFMSMGVLVEGFMARKVQVRSEFNERFTEFSSKEIEQEFRDLTGKQKTKKVKISVEEISES